MPFIQNAKVNHILHKKKKYLNLRLGSFKYFLSMSKYDQSNAFGVFFVEKKTFRIPLWHKFVFIAKYSFLTSCGDIYATYDLFTFQTCLKYVAVIFLHYIIFTFF